MPMQIVDDIGMAMPRPLSDVGMVGRKIVMAVHDLDRVITRPEQHTGRQPYGAECGERQHGRHAAIGGL